MGLAGWLRMLDIVGGLARRAPDPPQDRGGALAPFETRLLAFAFGAIKKAFDRDSDRMALEREHLEAERARAEAALRLEWLRQEADRRGAEARLLVMLALGVWIASAGIGVALADRYVLAPKLLLGAAWIALVGAIGAAIAAHGTVTEWMTRAAASTLEAPARTLVGAAMWLLVGGFTLAAASVLVAL
jgi:hypothetical protein